MLAHEDPLKSVFANVDMMTGKEFEHFLHEVFLALGYQAKITGRSGDKGVDLVLKKPNMKAAVQAKRLSGNVSHHAVEEVAAGAKHYGCSSLLVVSNTNFTKKAANLARKKNCQLIGKDGLAAMLAEIQHSNPAAFSKIASTKPIKADGKSPYAISETHPHLAGEWHAEKNSFLDIHNFVASNQRHVWWKCSKNPGHEWLASIADRAKKGSGCPICSGRKAAPAESLGAAYPEIAAELHPAKNGCVDPLDIHPRTRKALWWKCAADPSHEWKEGVVYRTKSRKKCPFCNEIANRLDVACPQIAELWHPTMNAEYELFIDRISVKEKNVEVFLNCASVSTHGHYNVTVRMIVDGDFGCPKCAWEQITKQRYAAKEAGRLYQNKSPRNHGWYKDI